MSSNANHSSTDDGYKKSTVSDNIQLKTKFDGDVFTLLIESQAFKKDQFKVKVQETKVIIEAAMKKKINDEDKDDQDQVDETLTYEHALPAKIDPQSVKCEYPAEGTIRVTGKCSGK